MENERNGIEDTDAMPALPSLPFQPHPRAQPPLPSSSSTSPAGKYPRCRCCRFGTPGTEEGRERREHLSTGRACAVMYGASERALPPASVRPPLGGLGAIVGAIADMRGMDGGIWHERKGEHGKGAFLGEATVQSKCVVPPRTRFHPSSTGLPSQVEKEGLNTSTLHEVSTVAEMPDRGGPDSEN